MIPFGELVGVGDYSEIRRLEGLQPVEASSRIMA